MFEPIALSLSEDGYYLSDSGGKDSGVIKRIAEKSGVKYEIVHNHTGLDHPETVYFVRREKARYEAMGIKYTVSMPGMSPWALMRKKGMPPTRLARYCCVYLKERGGVGKCVITGVRRAESTKRRNRGIAEVLAAKRTDKLTLMNDNEESRKEFETCPIKGTRIVNPIIDWEDSDVWEYTRKENIPYNPLYDRGYKRVGCVGCPMVDNAQDLENNPKYKAMYIKTFQRIIDERKAKGLHNYGYKNGEEYYLWWIGRLKFSDNGGNQVHMDEDIPIRDYSDDIVR
jgi:3'-phosphoadenosine 5'-phosphosulfate sulfotransferase (PAPS reductase)/FAD synthetase